VIAASIYNNNLKIREMANEQYLLSHPACALWIHRDTADEYTRFLEVFYEPLQQELAWAMKTNIIMYLGPGFPGEAHRDYAVGGACK
jgi:hypothetical protein